MNKHDEQEAERKNHNFVQLRKEVMPDMQQLVRANPIGAEVLLFLLGKMDKMSNAMVASYTLLQEQLGYSRPAIAKALKGLQADQWIEIQRSGNMSIYCVNSNVAWQAANNQRHYARFTATVLLSSSEQKQDVTKPGKPLKRVPAWIQNMPRDPSMDLRDDKESA